MSYVESALWDVEDFCRLKRKELKRSAVCKNIIHDSPGIQCTDECKDLINVNLRIHVRTLWLLIERVPNIQDFFIGWKDDALTSTGKTKATKKINVPWCTVCGLKGKKDLNYCKGCSASYHELCKLKICSSEESLSTCKFEMKQIMVWPDTGYPVTEDPAHSCECVQMCLDPGYDSASSAVCPQCGSVCRVKCGQVVWHKMKHSVWWPALLLPASERPSFLPRKPSKLHEAVRFYGEAKFAWADIRHMCIFNPNHYLKSTTNGNLKLLMAFKQAVQAYKEL